MNKNLQKLITFFSVMSIVTLTYAQNGGDDCASAVLVSPGSITQTTITQSTSGGIGGGSGSQDAAWFKYIAPANGAISIHSCNGGADTRLFIHEGATCPTSGSDFTDDDSCPFAADGTGSSYASELEDVPVTAGETYYIEWDDEWSESPFDWTLSYIQATSCEISSIVAGTTSPCDDYMSDQEFIITYSDAPTTGTLDVYGTSFPITSSPQSVNITLPAVGTDENITASFSEDAICTASITHTTLNCVTNASCAGATSIVPGVFNNAFDESTSNSVGGGTFYSSSWYKFIPTVDGLMTIRSCSGGADTRLWVHVGSDCPTSGSDFDADDECPYATDGTGSTFASELVDIQVTGGETYYIEWDNRWSSDNFIFSLEFSPMNDGCAQAVNLNGGGLAGMPTQGVVTGDTQYATSSTGGSENAPAATCGGDADDDIWFTFTSDNDGIVSESFTIDITPQGTFDPIVEVYSGSCGALSTLICGTTSTTLNNVSENTEYFIRVYDSGTGLTGGGAESRAASSFTIAISGSALPSEIVRFNGDILENYNELKWTTATERNVGYFVIERSIDGQNWAEVGKVQAIGESNSNMDYAFMDRQPLTAAYYRLMSMDNDGSFAYSNVISLLRNSNKFSLINITPNPVVNTTQVSFEVTYTTIVNASIYNATGQLIRAVNFEAIEGINQIEFDLSDESTGIYVMVLNSNEGSITNKFVKY